MKVFTIGQIHSWPLCYYQPTRLFLPGIFASEPVQLLTVCEKQKLNNLTVECPNVTLCYKVKITFLNTKFNKIPMKIANFLLLFGP